MPSTKLQSSDGEIFPVDVEIAKQSVTIKEMLGHLGMDEEDEEVLPLPRVNAAILKKVMQWAAYHKDDNPPQAGMTPEISSWDDDFLKLDMMTFMEILQAANYLNIERFVDVACKKLAVMIVGKIPEEIRKMLEEK